MRQAGALLSTALVHVELAERVLEGWTATEALPAIVMRADDRAEAAAAMARDLLHNLHTGEVHCHRLRNFEACSEACTTSHL